MRKEKNTNNLKLHSSIKQKSLAIKMHYKRWCIFLAAFAKTCTMGSATILHMTV